MSNGKKYKQLFPVKDKASAVIDTARFTKQLFKLSDFTGNKAYLNGKHIIVPLRGSDMQSFIGSTGRYYIYFWNSACAGTTNTINELDSLALSGQQIMVVSLRSNYNVIDKRLSKTSFAKRPYYIIEDKKYSNVLLVRQVDFFKEACEPCYEKYRDDLIFAGMLIDKAEIKAAFDLPDEIH